MRHLLLALSVLAATPAYAVDLCEELWYTRNQIIDKAGYCFGSPLGKAMFDNADCTGKSVTLSAAANQQIAELKRLEAEHQCKVDTNQQSLDILDLGARRRLTDLPMPTEYESGCIGWKVQSEPLYAGHSEGTPTIGKIEQGDDVLYSHYAYPQLDGWAYVTVWAGGWGAFKSAGWLRERGSDNCREYAG